MSWIWYHDETKAKRLSRSQPIRWRLIADYLLLPFYSAWGCILLIQCWFLLKEED